MTGYGKNQWKYQELQHLCKDQRISGNLRSLSFYLCAKVIKIICKI